MVFVRFLYPKLCPEIQPARLAQSAERTALNRVVVGSSPTVGIFFVFLSSSTIIAWKLINFMASLGSHLTL